MKKRTEIFVFLIVATVFIALFVAVANSMYMHKGSLPTSATPQIIDGGEDKRIEAYYMSQKFVTNRLKTPLPLNSPIYMTGRAGSALHISAISNTGYLLTLTLKTPWGH